MKSIERQFENYQKERPNISTLVNFAAAVKGVTVKHDTLRRWFNLLVDKEDYEGVSKVSILRWLDVLSNPSRTTINRGNSSIKGLPAEVDGD